METYCIKEIKAMENEFERKLLEDTLEDMRTERKFLKKLCVMLCVFIVILILGIIGICVYSQNKFTSFINEMNFTSEISMENEDSLNFGGINVK